MLRRAREAGRDRAFVARLLLADAERPAGELALGADLGAGGGDRSGGREAVARGGEAGEGDERDERDCRREPSGEAPDALRLADLDSLTAKRSGAVGHALLLMARRELARGDPARARELLARALPPLAAGYGKGHGLVRSAVALRDILAAG